MQQWSSKHPPGQAMLPPHPTKQCYHHTPPRIPDASQHKADQHLMQSPKPHTMLPMPASRAARGTDMPPVSFHASAGSRKFLVSQAQECNNKYDNKRSRIGSPPNSASLRLSVPHSGTRLLHSCVGSDLSLSHAFLAQLLHSCVGSALGSDLALRAASSFFDSSAMAVSLAWRADTSSCRWGSNKRTVGHVHCQWVPRVATGAHTIKRGRSSYCPQPSPSVPFLYTGRNKWCSSVHPLC